MSIKQSSRREKSLERAVSDETPPASGSAWEEVIVHTKIANVICAMAGLGIVGIGLAVAESSDEIAALFPKR